MKPKNNNMETIQNKINGENKNIDLIIRILLIIILFTWCGMIILPFVMPVLWGVILAISLFPLYSKLLKLTRGRRTLSSTFTSGILLLVLIVPLVFLISTIVQGVGEFITSIRDHTLVIPPPDSRVAGWPVIGKPIYNAWLSVTNNLDAAISQYSEQIIKFGDKFLNGISNVVSSFFMFILSIIISGILLYGSVKSEKITRNLALRLGGNKGEEFVDLVVLTIRNVVKGILGVAFIQFILLGTTFIVAKIPFAGLWALFVLLLAIIQLPTGIIGIPVIIYLYSTREPLTATLWAILILLLSLADNFIKPYLMGKGAPVPMIVIFLGAIGGMVMSGFIGLFTGAIILSMGYKLATSWLGAEAK